MKNLEITSTKILPITDGIGGCVAVAQIVLNDAIKLTGIKLIQTDKKRYISYPRNMSNKQKKSYFYPLTTEVSEFISKALWDAYDNDPATGESA